MVIVLGHKFAKLYNKLENHNHNHHHHHHDSQELSASLKAFRAEVSNLVNELASDSKPGSEILSLFWIKKCLGILPLINKAFTKFTLEIDYPMSKWEVDSIEEYLNYSLCLLELFNSISSSLSHLEKAKLSLIHNLKLLFEHSQSLPTSHHLKAIQPSCLKTKFEYEFCEKSHKVRFLKGKELIVNEAVNEMKIIGFWVCGILLSGLCNDVKPYIEVKKMVDGFDGSSIFTLDSKISEGLDEKKLILKEIKDVNDAVDYLLVASDEVKNDAAKELEIKVNKFVKVFDAVKSEVDDLFSKVMVLRTELIDQLRKQC
ncbi:hypothetical protein MtrunA17_Chr4g0020231 [Medicago truncatula]|uniref:BPS1, putative n=1 Tax=Medicago truncatula TaxID=3880 RepID=A0A072TVX0_MEDTR|nr:UPF0496 protein 4 [Medicago truncatula]KEH17670.1 BPS1, putative [Medicago truncatula]RHN59992.1 hypothetical protein MtrunA17_Chr4g0020231 [Medicago truncatula]